ncbi:DNA/RNA non-specific endonuclease [Runella slithyformis]|uniref:Endonuclease n=1 Tax=Runella slithyformis (strain ATCC 29530 / DSM 19594 / LMG 11500 / NCIMB 11436 / LSU 4) TaxID=761193 RepID=A0A7U4E788_RUNSL|nr:DNA/RNA non-specific endonuclease [Runella slithyformis]AEI50403.1 DNA/RNA non-specific endonuclease [Runella slithyformis DSM 19594]
MHRKGLRWGNTLYLLFFFIVIGLVLHYRGRTKPLVAFWNDVKSVFIYDKKPQDRGDNPYRNPEPDDVAVDDRTEDMASDDRSLLEKEGLEKRTDETTREEAEDNTPSTSTPSDFWKVKDFHLPAIGSNDQIIRHSRITLRYREQYEQADWVAYKLTDEEASAYLSRDGNKFVPDPLVTTGSAITSDYTRSGYDRGHLAPAGDFNLTPADKQETFYMSNISPQVPDFNRGIWNDLEQKFRQWAQRDGELYIVTGPVLKPGLPTIGNKNEIAVPERYYKIALCLTDAQPRMIGFVLNNEFSSENLKTFVVSVDEIEQMTGIDFFPRLPDAIEKKLESANTTKGWFSARN